jgi:hypothetical protein
MAESPIFGELRCLSQPGRAHSLKTSAISNKDFPSGPSERATPAELRTEDALER